MGESRYTDPEPARQQFLEGSQQERNPSRFKAKGVQCPKHSFKPVAFIASAVAVLLAALLVASMLGFGPFSSRSERNETVLLKSVRDVSQYHAAVGNFELLLDEKEDTGGLPEFIAGRRTLFVAAGTVNAYVDLSGLTEEDLILSEDGKGVTLRLPDPQLDKPNIDHDRSYVYS
ncbi:hypothetical protein QFZ60_003081 [Arthrobacter sp. B2I5]|uniref:DUF4230 domain-containing protein n=1 Tax=Arthrobacter sp. B2I5 TaxID=3042266 RepID=UPI00277F2F26|nr:DUF4230 domain-containing protein [Arthrobacter sp. B2I5]MDQ0826908.1 hypothetical protein [Arthrobacter sp. B2I5]